MKEKDLQSLLLEHPELIEEGLTDGHAEYSTSSGPVDLYFKDRTDKHLLIELKLNGGSTNEMQANRYAGAFCYDNTVSLQSIRKMLLALKIDEKTRKICEAGSIEIKELKQIPMEYCLNALEMKEPKVIEKEVFKFVPVFSPDLRLRIHDCYFDFQDSVEFRKIKALDEKLWKAGIIEHSDVDGSRHVNQCRFVSTGGTSLAALSLVLLQLDVAGAPIKTMSIQIFNPDGNGHRGIFLDLSQYKTSFERAFFAFCFIGKAMKIDCANETIFTNTDNRFAEPTQKLSISLPLFSPLAITSPTAGKPTESKVNGYE